jgi:rhodanese-related sulfurtransferase
MQQVLEAYPATRRAPFQRYHIGGCSSCGFQPEETVEQVCQRNNNLNVAEVIETSHTAHEADERMQVSVTEAAALVKAGKARLVDVRTQEEWDAVHIEGSTFLTQQLVHERGSRSSDQAIIFVCHPGIRSLDAATHFAGHNLKNARSMRRGIDAWSQEMDPKVPRCRVGSDRGQQRWCLLADAALPDE